MSWHTQPREASETTLDCSESCPAPYAKIVPGDGRTISILYNHDRAEHEAEFLRINELLESRRR